MSSLLVHLSVGLLVALALRLDWRLVPVAVFLAEVPDIDHLWGDGGRSAFHTAWFLIALPALAAGIGLAMHRVPRAWRALAAGAPVLLSTHLLLDEFQLPSEASAPGLPMFAPFDHRTYVLALYQEPASDPTAVTTMGIVALVLAVLCAWSVFVARGLDELSHRRPLLAKWLAAAYGVAWAPLLAFALVTRFVRPLG